MKMLIRIIKLPLAVLVLSTTILVNSQATAGTNAPSITDNANLGYKLLNQKRFANAEIPLRNAVADKVFEKVGLQGRMQVIGMLEYSLMAQGKYSAYESLIDGKLALLDKNSLNPSPAYGIDLMNKAEALYNLNRKSEAVAVAEKSYLMLKSLPSAKPDAVAHAKSNLAQFKANRPSEPIFPQDLSHFFTTCESIKKGTTMQRARHYFSDELEVGRGYQPTGVMKEIFASALPPGIDKASVEGLDRTVFIPDANHQSDWCIVFGENERVSMTVVSAD